MAFEIHSLFRCCGSLYWYRVSLLPLSFNMASTCDGCSYTYFKFIKEFHEDDEAAVHFLRSHGVLPLKVDCPECNLPCTYREDRHSWYCGRYTKIAKTKKRKQCNFTTSDFKGTFLEGTHVKPSEILCFVNHWLHKVWDHETIVDSLKWSITSVDWRSFCSEVAEWWFDNQNCIGGDGVEVEVDETLFVKRKYERGRVPKQVWVFGGIERNSKKCFLVPLIDKDRSANTLIPIIKQFIKPGSVIYSDSWRAYSRLGEEGYTHYTINHKENFVHPNNPNIHTQNIERLWLDLKQWAKRPGVRSEYLKQYFARYLFIRSVPKEQVQHKFFTEAARLYQPQSNRRRPLPVTPPHLQDDEDDCSSSDSDEQAGSAEPPLSSSRPPPTTQSQPQASTSRQ